MSITLRCPLNHEMQNMVDPDMNFQCQGCEGHIAPHTLHMSCTVSGCMHRVCAMCATSETEKQVLKKRQTETGSIAASMSPHKPGA
eukprot:7168810-Karenia_brevis.AAC.1